ncbi:MAG: hypothetical protein C5B52_01080 [Bacteroidetes bacterium]|nr:MAG: hypothetical protein C5B52_01080 [Bacteroidota bacterium]
MIGMHRVKCPSPQSNGTTKILGFSSSVVGFEGCSILLIFGQFAFIRQYFRRKIVYFTVPNFMKKVNYKIFFFLFLLALIVAGCGIFKGGQKGCGCPNKKGMVGY